MDETHITEEQLAHLSHMLRPIIANFLKEPVGDTMVKITCTPVEGDPQGAAVMRFHVQVRGEDLPPEREAQVTRLLSRPEEEKPPTG